MLFFFKRKRKAKCNNYRPFTIMDRIFRINCNYILKTWSFLRIVYDLSLYLHPQKTVAHILFWKDWLKIRKKKIYIHVYIYINKLDVKRKMYKSAKLLVLDNSYYQESLKSLYWDQYHILFNVFLIDLLAVLPKWHLYDFAYHKSFAEKKIMLMIY